MRAAPEGDLNHEFRITEPKARAPEAGTIRRQADSPPGSDRSSARQPLPPIPLAPFDDR